MDAGAAPARMSSPGVEFGLTALAAMCSPTTLTFSVLALVLSDRPGRTGGWFFAGAFATTILVGVLAAIVLGGAAAPAAGSSNSPTWVSILDLVLGALLILYVIRTLRRPADPTRVANAVKKMTDVAASPPLLVAAAGATLANPGAFLAIAVKNVSQLDPSPVEYTALWLAFALVALLPLLSALVALRIDRHRTTAVLTAARRWLEGHVRTIAVVIVLLLAASLLRNGIVALT